MNVDWKSEIKLQKRISAEDFWKDLDLILFDPTDDGRVKLSYSFENEVVHETKAVKELLNAEFGLRIVENN